MLEVPSSSIELGFENGPGGTHTSRTIMLKELRLILMACPPSADFDEYRAAIVDENVLLKETVSTRLRSLRGLRELYGLNREVVLFRALRDLWDDDFDAQPLLALLSATARDPLLRGTSKLIFETSEGAEVTPHSLAKAVNESFPDRYNPSILAKVGRDNNA